MDSHEMMVFGIRDSRWEVCGQIFELDDADHIIFPVKVKWW
jgi:hypothetical protein